MTKQRIEEIVQRLCRRHFTIGTVRLAISVLIIACVAGALTVGAVGLVQRRLSDKRRQSAVLRVKRNQLSTIQTLKEIHQAERRYFDAAGCYAALPELRVANQIDDATARGIKDGYMIFEEHDCDHLRVFAVPLVDSGDNRTGDFWYVLLPDGRVHTQEAAAMPRIEPEPLEVRR